MEQLSQVHAAFGQFCGVLKELILNQQVAHSVVQSLHDDLPCLQPEPPAGTRTLSPAQSGADVRPGGSQRSGTAAADTLACLAPRLTPTAAAAACRAPAPVPSNPAAASPASECQDNYIVLQNAAAKSQRLLAQMQKLRGAAMAALQAHATSEAASGAAEARGERDAAVARTAMRWPPTALNDSGGDGAFGSDGVAGPLLDGEPSPGLVDVDVDVEVEVNSDLHAAVQQLTMADGDPAGVAGTSHNAAGSARARARAPQSTPGGGVPETPAPAARSSAAAPTAAPTSTAGPAGSTPAAPVAWAAAQAAAVAAGPAPVLAAAEMVILMGALCGCASKEAEMLTRIAASVQLSTTAQELYSYGYMLKLQPYMDERLVAAVEAAVLPDSGAARRAAAATAPGAASALGRG